MRGIRRRSNPVRCNATRIYEVRPRSDKRGVDLIGDALPFGRLWYEGRERDSRFYA